MIVALTVDTINSAIGSAVGCTVLISTSAASVLSCLAVSSDVAVVLTFGAPKGFLLVLTDCDALIVDAETVSEYVVCHVCVGYMEKCEGFTLFFQTMSWGFDPAY